MSPPALETRLLGPLAPALLTWLREGVAYPGPGRARLWQYRWASLTFRFNLSMQRRLQPASPPGPDPLLVLGAWRSGTTFLHELLASQPGFVTPRTWQCMAPSTFGLTGAPSRGVVQARPMDDFTIAADSPQEDEFALLALGGPSLYRAFLDPRRLESLAPLLDGDAWTSPWPAETDWLEFLGRVGGQAGDHASRLLLKSPNHSYRLPALQRQFPRMQGIWITRDPRAIWQSNRRLWPTMAKLYGLAPMDEAALDRFLVRMIACTAKALNRWCDALPPERLVVLSLEQLKVAPESLTTQALARLGSAPPDADGLARLHAAAAARAHVRTAAERGELSVNNERQGEMAQALESLAEAQRRALASHGLDA